MSTGSPADVGHANADRKRFATGDHPDIEDVANPHTTEDETHTSRLEQLKEYRWFLVVGLPIGLAFTALLIGYTWHIVPEILGNRYIQATAGLLTLVGTTAYLADKRREKVFMQYDWLVLRTSNGPQRFLGHVKQDSEGTVLFAPVKGFGLFGSRAAHYTVAEFGRELAESWQKTGTDGDDPALIRLHPAFVSVTKTDQGMIVEQATTKVKTDSFAQESTLYAPEPEIIERDTAEDLKQIIVDLREERDAINDRLEKFKRRLDAAKETGAKTPDEWLESHKEFYKELRNVDRARSQTTSSESPPNTGGRDPELQRVENELTANE